MQDHRSVAAEWARRRDEEFDRFARGDTSFLEGLLPESAVRFGVADTVDLLRRRL